MNKNKYMEKVTIEEIWEIEKLAGQTGNPHELLAIQLLVEKKRALYKEQQWEKYHEEYPQYTRAFWEQWEWSEPPVGYKALQTVKMIMFDVGNPDAPITDWQGNPLDENWNPIKTVDNGDKEDSHCT
jgi:hypothetical protein